MVVLISFISPKKKILSISTFDEITDFSYCFCFNDGLPSAAGYIHG